MLTTVFKFYAAALSFFNKVLFYCKDAFLQSPMYHFLVKTFGSRMGSVAWPLSRTLTAKQYLVCLSFHVLRSLHAFLESPEELPGESCCRQLTFFQASVPIFTPKDGGSNLVLLWTSILLLIHQQMAVENSLPTYLET